MSVEPLETRVAVLEVQVGRIVSDIESEKATRARVNEDIIDKLDKMDTAQRRTEKILYMGLGALAVLQFILHK